MSTPYRFGPFLLDPAHGLLRDGQPVHLTPKELALLELLLQFDGKLVSHACIESTVWPRQVVSYDSVARCVYGLRKSLEDEQHTIVVCVPKQGYRLGLKIRKVGAVRNRSTREMVSDAAPAVYAGYMESQNLANQGSFEALRRARQLIENTCEMDPFHAPAHSLAADIAMFQSTRGYDFPDRALSFGLERSARAIELDDSLAAAHAALGWFQCVNGQTEAGFASLQTALAIDPEYARAYSYLSFAQRAAGLREESLATARRAVELDPYSVLHRHALAWRLFCSGLENEAQKIEETLRREYPEDPAAHSAYGLMAAWNGETGQALEATETAVRLSGENPGIMTLHASTLAMTGKKVEANALARTLEDNALPRAPRTHLAMVYAVLDETERALELLQVARAEQCPWFRPAVHDPRAASLATDDRFLAMFSNHAS